MPRRKKSDESIPTPGLATETLPDFVESFVGVAHDREDPAWPTDVLRVAHHLAQAQTPGSDGEVLLEVTEGASGRRIRVWKVPPGVLVGMPGMIEVLDSKWVPRGHPEFWVHVVESALIQMANAIMSEADIASRLSRKDVRRVVLGGGEDAGR